MKNERKRTEMRQFFYPESLAVFGVADSPGNLGKNIIFNCQSAGFKGNIYPVGRIAGNVYGTEIITDTESLPRGIDLAVILVPAKFVSDTMETCGKKGIRNVIISSGGFSEFNDVDNQAEQDVQAVARQYGIRFMGPNCIGVICTNSSLCTPFNPLNPQSFKKGKVSVISQSGGVTSQSACIFSEEHIGFSKVISVGNKLDIDENDLLRYLIDDDDTEQIHLYLESIDDGREFMRLTGESKKPIVIFKSNTGRTASVIAMSHTAALSNNDRIVEGALKQAGIVRVEDIHDMTVCAKALSLPPLKGNRLVAISPSGGYAVILGDLCERHGFECPELPQQFLNKMENQRRAGVIRMANPLDLGDIYSVEAAMDTLEDCLTLDDIDGIIISYVFSEDLPRIFNTDVDAPKEILKRLKNISERTGKPIALSFFAERHFIEEFKRIGTFPVFNDPMESVRALRILGDYWRGRSYRNCSNILTLIEP